LTGASFYLDRRRSRDGDGCSRSRCCTRSPRSACAMEPHVAELCRFLRAMGASIEGEGTTTLQ
jgi:hypothetical protein